MDWSGEWWVLILGPGLVILTVGILYFTRSRAFRFRSAAAQLGFIALQGLHPISEEDKNKSDFFSKGGKISNLFGDRVHSPSRLIFDWTGALGSSPQTSAKNTQTVAAFAVSGSGIPDFRMSPVDALGGVRANLDPQPLHFDSHPDFGRRYTLAARNEAAARAFFNLAFLDRLTACDPKAMWSVEKAGSWLLVYRRDFLFPPQSIPESWQNAQALADLFVGPR